MAIAHILSPDTERSILFAKDGTTTAAEMKIATFLATFAVLVCVINVANALKDGYPYYGYGYPYGGSYGYPYYGYRYPYRGFNYPYNLGYPYFGYDNGYYDNKPFGE